MELVGENEVESEHEKSKVMVVEKKKCFTPQLDHGGYEFFQVFEKLLR